jgi:hypothetical protein
MKQIDPAHIQPFGGWHDVAVNLRTKDVQNAYLPASVDNTDAEKPPVTSLVDTRSGVSESQFDCVRSGHFRMAGHHAFPGSRVHRAVLVHGGRMHRFGRRRMIVVIGGPEKHASADIVPAAGQTGADAKAEASGKNRRDAGQRKVAEGGDQAKRQVSQGKVNHGKEAAQSTDRTQRIAKAQDAKGKDTKGKDTKGKDTKEANGKDTKAQKVAGSKHPLKHAADASERQAKPKAKNRVADQQDASPSKKL